VEPELEDENAGPDIDVDADPFNVLAARIVAAAFALAARWARIAIFCR
jgi:hypothetical protein